VDEGVGVGDSALDRGVRLPAVPVEPGRDQVLDRNVRSLGERVGEVVEREKRGDDGVAVAVAVPISGRARVGRVPGATREPSRESAGAERSEPAT